MRARRPQPQASLPASAFTLVELLVVVAIIGVLAAMLIPAVSVARGKARQVNCANHLGQIGKALTMYAQDHNGFLPPAGCGGIYVGAGGNIMFCCGAGVGLGRLHDRYLPGLEVLFCSDANVLTADNPTFGAPAWGTGPVLGSYRYREGGAGGDPRLDRNLRRVVVCDYSNPAADLVNHAGRGSNLLRGDGSVVWAEGAFDASTDDVFDELDER